MKNKPVKGSYGHLDYQKKAEICKTVLLFILAFAIFITGYLTTKTKMNLLTVVAVVSVLPASKSLTTTILYLRYRTGSSELYEEIRSHAKNLTAAYDLVITSYQKNIPLFAAVMTENVIAAYSEKKELDTSYSEKFIKEVLEKNGFSGLTLKIFTDKKAFLDRLDSMNQNLPAPGEKILDKQLRIKATLMAISI